jgi:rhamnosyltransferase
METYVVMRSRNDIAVIGQTLSMLYSQREPFKLIVFDNKSDDGTREELEKYPAEIITVPRGAYVPGRVLNQGMELSGSEYVVFLNSDCTPQDEYWLTKLLAGFSNAQTAAVFGRQIPRPDASPLFIKDTENTFGNGERQKYWRHCFSMAASAIRRSVWKEFQFNESIQYSEDIEWTWRARQRGYQIQYVADAVAMHSHNYSLSQFYKRNYGEGKAEATIFDWTPWQQSWLRYSILPYLRQVLSDLNYCLTRFQVGAALYSPVLRAAQLLGRRHGFQAGQKSRAIAHACAGD